MHDNTHAENTWRRLIEVGIYRDRQPTIIERGPEDIDAVSMPDGRASFFAPQLYARALRSLVSHARHSRYRRGHSFHRRCMRDTPDEAPIPRRCGRASLRTPVTPLSRLGRDQRQHDATSLYTYRDWSPGLTSFRQMRDVLNSYFSMANRQVIILKSCHSKRRQTPES